MKKSAILFLVSFFLVMTVSVYAQEESQSSGDQVATEIQAEEEVTIQDLGVEEPTLLPTSPFYFLKNWGRSINRTFTFNSVKKAELELEIVNEKVAEIKKMERVAPDRVEAIGKAVENYQANTERLKTRLESLKETSANPNVDKLLEKLTDRGIKHQQVFDELKGKFEANKELKDKFEKAQERMNETIVKVPEKFEKPEDFGKRIERVLEARRDGGVFKDLRSAEMMDRLNEAGAPQEIRQQFQGMKDNFMDRFENKVGTLNEEERVKVLRPEILEKLPGDNMRRMQILDEVAGRSEDPNIKSRFEGLGEEIIKRQSEKIDVKQEDAQKRISDAEDIIAKVETKISADMTIERQTPKRDFGDRMKAGLEMARGNLVKAKESFTQGKFGEAFGQATSAIAKAKSILNQLESINRIDSTPARTNMPILPEGSGLPINPLLKPLSPEQIKAGQTLPEGNVLPVKPPISISPISPEQIVCTQDVNPVCGKDGKNYSNPCYAKKAGIIIAYSGVCRAGIEPIR